MKKTIRVILMVFFIFAFQNFGMSHPPGDPDVNGNGAVTMADYWLADTDAKDFVLGSLTTDIDNNGITDINDLIIIFNAI